MNKFNSGTRVARTFNAAKPKKEKENGGVFQRKIREVANLFPMRGSNMDGWSQLSTDPNGFLRLRDHKRMVEHYLYGCQAPIIKGETNDDGTQARACANPSCHGRWQGQMNIDGGRGIPQDVAELMGIASDKTGHIHYQGDHMLPKPEGAERVCYKPHYGLGKVTSDVSLADIANMRVRVPGYRRPLKINTLLANDSTVVLGHDQDGLPIYPSRYATDKRTGQHKHDSADLRVQAAHFSAMKGMRLLIEAGETDPRKYFDVAKTVARQVFRTKNKELDPSHPDPEGYAGINPGSPERDPLHKVVNGSLKTIRDTLGDQAIVVDKPIHRQWWDDMKSPDFTMTFNPNHVFDEQLNPMNHVIDIQHRTKLATSTTPGVQLSYFAAHPEGIPDVGSMSELGNVGKKDPFASFWRSGRLHDLIHRLVRDYKERDNPTRVENEKAWVDRPEATVDKNFLEQARQLPTKEDMSSMGLDYEE